MATEIREVGAAGLPVAGAGQSSAPHQAAASAAHSQVSGKQQRSSHARMQLKGRGFINLVHDLCDVKWRVSVPVACWLPG